MTGKTPLHPIRIINCALDETPKGEIVLRGVVDQDSLVHLKVDDYQREAAPLTALSSIIGALKNGETLPDIELGMRGHTCSERDSTAHLKDSVYIIDGFQRVNGALHFLAQNPGANVRLGATIHFGTTKEWERERFRILNTLRSKVSPNVILRNSKADSPAVSSLYSLSTSDKGFAMCGRVSWNQRMTRGEIISALTMLKVVGLLHSHKVAARSTRVDELVPALDKVADTFGINTLRANTKAFFELVDECWGVKRIQYREGAIYVRGTFLNVLARVISDHHDFWRQPDEKMFVVEASLRRKISLFPINDPQIISLAGGNGKAIDMLYILMRDHVNSGKRTKRLKSRRGDTVSMDNNDDLEEGES